MSGSSADIASSTLLDLCMTKNKVRKMCIQEMWIPLASISAQPSNQPQFQIVNGTGSQTRAGLPAGLQGYGYGYEISTLAKPVPLATGIGVGRKENFKLYA